MITNKKIVCLGGGIGTSNLIRGLKHYTSHLTVVTSMADDGGSSGRLRKAYSIMPPGDMVSCIAALVSDENHELAALLTHRFPGSDKELKGLGGHKVGNLLMLAEIQRTHDFYKALDAVKNMFGVTANILPATDERTHLSAITQDGRRVHTETTLDLALYSEPYGLKKIYLRPKNPKVNKRVIKNIQNADIIISGPGDLYTNQLPVLVVPEIKEAILKSRATKVFIVNIANKPFETKGFTLSDFVNAITEHMGEFPFNVIFANNKQDISIPKKFHYKYIKIDEKKNTSYKIVQDDFINEQFPLYHDPIKLAKTLHKTV